MRGIASAFFVLAMLGLVASCSVDDAANGGMRCDDAGTCPEGMSCYRGFCIMGGGGSCSEVGAVQACYGGPAGTEAVSPCRPGERMCTEDLVWSACLGEVQPGIETCNGIDDDCNGTPDDLGAMTCNTGQPGACGAGELVCMGSMTVCQPTTEPAVETCNDIDDDCDNRVDDNTAMSCYPDGEAGCSDAGDGTFACVGVCVAGARACTGGELGDCEDAITPAATDDCTAPGTTAADDNCNGSIDEDCDCTTLSEPTQPCYGGPTGTAGMGVCVMGTQTCDPATMRFGDCEGAITPTVETCNDLDDDCDGTIDDVTGVGDPCTVAGEVGECRSGTRTCAGTSLECVGPEATPEVCDGLDNDCNGTIDDGFDLSTDAANCGACGNACGDGLSCCAGACVDLDVSRTHCGECGNGCGELGCCDGECIDTTSDEMSCGMCGNACAAGFQCCGGACVDTRTSTTRCGGCSISCAAGESCCGGTCAAPDSTTCVACTEDCSATGTSCCAGSCTDMGSDPSNCGMCGRACAAGELCCGGTCTPNDEANCGSCGLACEAGEYCCSSSCVPMNNANCEGCGMSCAAGQVCCGDAGCVSTGSDERHCGGCGVPCDEGDTCSNGTCCGPGLTGCGGVCVNTSTDSANCGSCGRNCLLLRCSGGACL